MSGGPGDHAATKHQDQAQKHRENRTQQDKSAVGAWNARGDRGDQARAQAGRDRGTNKPTAADWNRKVTEVPVDQRAERQKIAETAGHFIGMPHGKSDRQDLRDNVLQVLKKELATNHGLLGGFHIEVSSPRSRTGSDAFNQKLAQQTIDNTIAVLKALLREGAVQMHPSSVDKGKALGEAPARDAGVPDGVDRKEDRGVYIRFVLDEHKEPPKDRPAEKLKTDIPDRYQKGYTVDRPTAERLVDAPDKWSEKVKDPSFWKQIVENPDKVIERLGKEAGRQLIETYKRLTDGMNRWNDQCARATPEDALWKVRPPYPLGENKSFLPFKENIKHKLKKAGYQPSDQMYREYLVHWYRKGER